MTHELEDDETYLDREARLAAEVHVHAAAFYVSCIRNGFIEEATEFAEWYLDAFDHDLES